MTALKPSGSYSVMAQRVEPPNALDYFPTPPWATRALCEWLSRRRNRPASVWEPACGEGHMSRVLAEYFEVVISSDVHPYGFGEVGDFLWPSDVMEDWIITNPPFALADQFAHVALRRARHGVALLVRTTFLEGIGRYNDLFSINPPTDILQFAERVPMHKGRLTEEGSTATAYCWLVWRKTPKLLEPRFHWIPPCRRRLEKPGDYDG